MTVQLAERFRLPAHWDTHVFTNPDTNHRIHFGKAFPDTGEPPEGIVVIFNGLSEFTEKYAETIRDMLDRNMAVWSMDWQYQGRSGRYPDNPMRRHSDGFNTDVSDMTRFVEDYVYPAAANARHGSRPLFMLSHSTGGNLAARYLSSCKHRFKAAAFTAPYWGTYTEHPLRDLADLLFSKKDWHESLRRSDGTDRFSSDPERDGVHNALCKIYPELRINRVELGWVLAAAKSIKELRKPGMMERIDIPTLVALGTKDTIVCNKAIREGAARMPDCQLLELDGALHEILMERDIYRAPFLNAFDKMVEPLKISTRHVQPA